MREETGGQGGGDAELPGGTAEEAAKETRAEKEASVASRLGVPPDWADDMATVMAGEAEPHFQQFSILDQLMIRDRWAERLREVYDDGFGEGMEVAIDAGSEG